MNESAIAKPQLLALTGVRFWAALHVAIHHVVIVFHIVGVEMTDAAGPFQEWCALGALPFEQSRHLGGLVRSGFVAVGLFFTLSGFILTYTCLDPSGQARVGRREFWVARFARVYPVYFVGLLINVPTFLAWAVVQKPPLSGGQLSAVAAGSVVLLQAWWPFSATAWNAPGWSLSVEAFFYLLFPFLIVAIDRLSRRQLWTAVILVWSIALLAPAVYLAVDPETLGRITWTSEGTWLRVIKYNPLLRLPEFVVGMLLGKLYGQQAAQNARLARGGGGWVSVLAAVAIIVTLAQSGSLPYPLVHNGLMVPLFGLLICSLALGGGPLAWLLSRRISVLLGDASYALYILHAAVIAYALVAVWLGLGGLQELERELAKQEAAKKAAAGQANGPTADQRPAPVEPTAETQAAANAQGVPPAEKTVATPTLADYADAHVPNPMMFLVLCVTMAVGSSILVHILIEIPSRRFVRRKLSRRHPAVAAPAQPGPT